MTIPKSDTKPCRACGQPIVFAVIGQTRKRGPQSQSGPRVEDKITTVDPVPSDAGQYTMTQVGDTYQSTKVTHPGQLVGLRAHGVPLYQSHAKTCPKHDEFIRLNRGARP